MKLLCGASLGQWRHFHCLKSEAGTEKQLLVEQEGSRPAGGTTEEVLRSNAAFEYCYLPFDEPLPILAIETFTRHGPTCIIST
ncbi:uncharacterized protein ACO6RY_12636 [Pungitius sinensis]